MPKDTTATATPTLPTAVRDEDGAAMPAKPSKLQQRQARLAERQAKNDRKAAVEQLLLSADVLKAAVRAGDRGLAFHHAVEINGALDVIWPAAEESDGEGSGS